MELSSHARRVWAVVALTLLAAWVTPAFAANDNCNAGSFKISPNKQDIQEFNAGNGYAPTLVTLGINKSLAADNATATWAQTGGPTVTLNTSNPQNPTFLSPGVGPAGATLTFRLTVTCPGGSSASDAGTVSIIDTNRPPVAFAQASPPIAQDGATITLTSTGTSDPDGDTLVYQWTKTAGPAVTLTNPTGAMTTFVAPDTGTGYTLQFQLQVRDRPTGGLTNTANVVVNITHDLPPLAKLTCPETANEHASVLLDGSATSDPNGGQLTYAWEQLQGSPFIQVGGETGNQVQFTAPALTTGQDGFLEFQLTATDSTSLSDIATCWVQIVDVTPPRILPPTDMVEEADSAAGKAVSFMVYAQDAVDDALPYVLNTCTPASGSTFALAPAPTKAKTTSVSCTAKDSAGNVGTGGFNITVQDTTAPALTVPGAFGVEATSAAGAIANFDVGATDAVDGIVGPDCNFSSGDQFPLGDTTVSCSATDSRTNKSADKTFVVSVIDTTKPVVDVPDDIVAEAASSQGAKVDFSVSASDTVSGPLSPVCIIGPDHPVQSGDLFALGDTTVSCSATDGAGNTGTASFKITVRDTTPPVVVVPDDIIEEATSPQGAKVNFLVAASDAVSGPISPVCIIGPDHPVQSGDVFPLGDSTVECSAVDEAGNKGSKSFKITVRDTTPPTVVVPLADVVKEATSPDGAKVDFEVSASDLVSGAISPVCIIGPDHPVQSGDVFALGDTTVSCSAVDDAGNKGTASFKITVQDTTPPDITVPVDIVKEATSSQGANVDFAVSASDLVSGSLSPTCSIVGPDKPVQSGDLFALGVNTLSCSATDNAGNKGSASFKITVRDTTPPTIAAHGPVGPVEATSANGASVSYLAPGTTDVVDGNGTASCLPASGTTFALGSTTVHCRAQDAAGNHASPTEFLVLVVDTTAPVIAAHGDVTAEATGPAGAAVGYTSPTTTDAVDGNGSASCLPLSGSTFAYGDTTVQCGAQDAAGNQATGTSFVVHVVDTTPPVLSAHTNVYANATGNSSAAVSFTLPTANDLVTGSRQVSCTPASGSTFVVGHTTVTCSASDGHGNTGTGQFEVEVGYSFTGFFQPIDNANVNTTKAGSAIPVKFSLGGNQGLDIFATNSPSSVPVQCDTLAPTDEIETTVTAGGSTLQYDATSGQYIYVWKTEKSWLGCRQLKVTLKDGSTRTAVFKFR